MTKEQLLSYQAVKKEKCQIERRLQSLEKRPEEEQELLQSIRTLYREKLDALVALQVSIERAIDALGPVEREIFRYRYIDGLEWHQIEAKMHYSSTSVHRIHSAALIKLENK